MTDCIEREKTIKPICEACNKQFPEEPCEPSDCTIMQMLRSIPAADVRPVVTCIECKHSCDMPGGLCCCYGTWVDVHVDPEFFCADGEKREES